MVFRWSVRTDTAMGQDILVTCRLRLSPTSVAQTTHRQRDRALLRGSAKKDSAHGVFRERRKCGSHYLFHFQRLNLEWKNRGPARQRVRSRCVAMECLVGWLLIGRRSA